MNFFRKLSDIFLRTDTPPTLRSIKKSNPFIVPENYFNSLENSIMQYVQTNSPAIEPKYPNTNKISLIKTIASVVFVVAIPILLYLTITKNIEIFEKHSEIDSINSKHIISKSDKIAYTQSTDNKRIETIINIDNNSNFRQSNKTRQTETLSLINVPSDNQEVVDADKYRNISTANIDDTTNVITSQQTPNQNELLNNFIALPQEIFPAEICEEEAFVLQAPELHHSFQYRWSIGKTTSSIKIEQSGVYTLEIFQSDCPENRQFYTTKVSIIPAPINAMKSIQTLCYGSTLTLEASIQNINDYQLFWNTDKYSKSLTIDEPGLYILTINGCKTYYDSVLVTLDHCDIKIPNSFTPNNDGINDIFYIHGIEKHEPVLLHIYDRNGFLVFSSNNYQNNWNAENTTDGTYYYIFKFNDGIQKHGTVTIFR